MNSIKIVKLENFQSHLNTVITIAPNGNLSVITGSSDSGKTALLRALKWVFFNTPSGDDFVRAGATFARVTVEFASGDVVVRWRSTGSINRYIVNGETYEGFGGNVPLEASQVSGIMPVKIGDLELNLNLAEQLQGPFLGSAISGGARAKVLGKLAGTEEIDYAAKQLGTDLYRRNQDEKRLSVEVAGLDEDIKAFEWLPGAKRKIEKLELLVERIKVGQALRGKLAVMAERVDFFNEKIAKEKAVLYRWRHLEDAENQKDKITASLRDKALLEALIVRYRTAQGVVLGSEVIVARHANLPAAEVIFLEAQEKAARLSRLRSLEIKHIDIEDDICRCRFSLNKLQGLDAAEVLIQGAQASAEKASRLRHMRTSYNAGQEMIKRSQDTLDRLDGLSAAWLLLLAIDAKKLKREKLINLRLMCAYKNEAIGLMCAYKNEAIAETERRLKELAGVDEVGAMAAKAEEKQLCLDQLKALKEKYTLRLDAIEVAREQALKWENRVAELIGAYNDELEMHEICPMCGQKINSQKVRSAS